MQALPRESRTFPSTSIPFPALIASSNDYANIVGQTFPTRRRCGNKIVSSVHIPLHAVVPLRGFSEVQRHDQTYGTESAWTLSSVCYQCPQKEPSLRPGWPGNTSTCAGGGASVRSIRSLQLAVCRRHCPSLVAPFADACVVLLRASNSLLGRQLTYNRLWADVWTIDDGDRVDVQVLKRRTRKLEIVIDGQPLSCIVYCYLLGPFCRSTWVLAWIGNA